MPSSPPPNLPPEFGTNVVVLLGRVIDPPATYDGHTVFRLIPVVRGWADHQPFTQVQVDPAILPDPPLGQGDLVTVEGQIQTRHWQRSLGQELRALATSVSAATEGAAQAAVHHLHEALDTWPAGVLDTPVQRTGPEVVAASVRRVLSGYRRHQDQRRKKSDRPRENKPPRREPAPAASAPANPPVPAEPQPAAGRGKKPPRAKSAPANPEPAPAASVPAES
ncbi:MAG: hypothetical protein KKA73_05460 [Chloroflexi bacterium]|nr:hypothetical protein [Chloroflexota bacterium]MBU1747115.1 hypothetical protein [Chloroflexota bacterium]